MTLERLWAGWRMDYLGGAGEDGPADAGCVFCRILESDEADEATKVVWRGRGTNGTGPDGTGIVVMLNAYPYTSGHLMVMPERHVGELEALEPPEAERLWAAATMAVRALKAAYQPDGINLGANLGRAAGAGVPGHFHVHLVPRWNGDTNFMTTVAEARVLPESLDTTWRKLRDSWPTDGAGPS